MPAAGALQQRCPHRPRFVVPASRTTKTLRPAELTQILSTGLLGGETRLELGQIPRIIFHFPDPTSCGHLSQVNTHPIALGGLAVTSLVTSLTAPIVLVQWFLGLTVGCVVFCRKVGRDAWKWSAIAIVVFFMTVGIRRILPLYDTGKDPIAILSRIAGSTGPHDRDPLIVFAEVAGPTASFYSHRPHVWVRDRKGLREVTDKRSIHRIILGAEYLPSLSKSYDVEVVESKGRFVYAKFLEKGPQSQPFAKSR